MEYIGSKYQTLSLGDVEIARFEKVSRLVKKYPSCTEVRDQSSIVAAVFGDLNGTFGPCGAFDDLTEDLEDKEGIGGLVCLQRGGDLQHQSPRLNFELLEYKKNKPQECPGRFLQRGEDCPDLQQTCNSGVEDVRGQTSETKYSRNIRQHSYKTFGNLV